MGDSTIIEVADLRLTLDSAAGSVNILRGIDLSVAAGESVSIVGPSGSGKSTLLAILGGLERASSGTVRIAGQDLGAMDEDALAAFRRYHIGIVFQSFHLLMSMNALENVAVPLELAGRADAMERAAQLLERVGLAHRRHHYPAQLSGGEQQRVALARAMAPEPAILLADEPTGNLDARTGAQVIDLLFGLHRSQGNTLIMVTHDDALAARCGRRLRIDDGRIIDDAVMAGEAAS